MDVKHNIKRRDFIVLSGAFVVGAGIATALSPFLSYLGPDAGTLAESTVDVDIKSLAVGQSIRVLWQGKPVFLRRRTETEIQQAQSVDLKELPDPQKDEDRVQRRDLLVVLGVCTHLGCVPLGQKGDYGGWFCPCHGSHYDTSGRIRKGPAPKNLVIPDYSFVKDSVIRIGYRSEEGQDG